MITDYTIKHPAPTAATFAQANFRVIGKDRCGLIYEQEGTPDSIKTSIEAPNASSTFLSTRGLKHQFWMHCKIQHAMQCDEHEAVCIPLFFNYVHQEEVAEWKQLSPKLSPWHPAYQSTDLLITERIPSLPDPYRTKIIELYCHQDFREAAYASEQNRHCLLLPEFGKPNGISPYNGVLDVHEFEACCGQVRDICTASTNHLMVRQMGRALASMHWRAKVDGHGVKYVFGGEPCEAYNDINDEGLDEPFSNMNLSDDENKPKPETIRRSTACLWMTDFDQVSPINDLKDFLPMAIKSFFTESRLFYPRPGMGPRTTPQDLKNWTMFRKAYTEQAQKIGQESGRSVDMRYVRAFLNAIEDRCDNRREHAAQVRRRKAALCRARMNCPTDGRFTYTREEEREEEMEEEMEDDSVEDPMDLSQ